MQKGFSPATRAWFDARFSEPTPVQSRGWSKILAHEHALLIAPTGSGKTLAAFLAGIDQLFREPGPGGIQLVYVSPLKALAYDIERNLSDPLVGIAQTAERMGQRLPELHVDVRTGDTPQRERQRQARSPAPILVTTPESLYLLLGSKARVHFASVRQVIVDEIHTLAPGKRGVHLALSLERLADIAAADPQRIGLSATVNPPASVARYLGGDREVAVVDASDRPNLDLLVSVPVPNMDRPDAGAAVAAESVDAAANERGIWSSLYPAIAAAIKAHRSTIVFVNSRGLCERLTQELNETLGDLAVRAHHGSVSHAQRAEIEAELKAGRLRGIVATSSLELGIDMGSVDQVLLVESPGSVARGLQRVGRAGHQVGAASRGVIFPKFKGDLLEAAVVASRMLTGGIESVAVPERVLDVLAQQIVAMCAEGPRAVTNLLEIIRRTASFADLSRDVLDSVLDLLSGRYPSDDFSEIRPLLVWDRQSDELRPRRGAAYVARISGGTIPDRGAFGVFLVGDGPRVGELDEEMVFETRPGDNILLGASTWRVEEITRDRVLVSPAPGEPGRLPFWRGDGPGRPLELGRELGAFARALSEQRDRQRWLLDNTPLDAMAARNLADYVADQLEHTGTLPTDQRITVERFRDELGDWRLCILSPFGASVHAPWALAIEASLSLRAGHGVQVVYSDDGIVLRAADGDDPIPAADLIIEPEELDDLIAEQLRNSPIFAGLFRENAARALLLPRRRPGQRQPLWAQRLRSANLLAAAQRFPSFPIVLETYRQILADVFDVSGLKLLLGELRSGRIGVDEVETTTASPFSRSLAFAYVANYLYDQDQPLAERRAQALTIDRGLLAELLGEAEQRSLIDADVLAAVAEGLLGLTPEQLPRDADELHDALRRFGDLRRAEVEQRGENALAWLKQLCNDSRALCIRVAGEERYIAAEDAGLYRDALGIALPRDLPEAFLEPAEDPFRRVVQRFARWRPPFVAQTLAQRLGVTRAQLEPALETLVADGLLIYGNLHPEGREPEWCHELVWRRLKQATLAKLRGQVTPVEGPAFAQFLCRWQRIDRRGSGVDALRTALHQIEGLTLPVSALVHSVLPKRVADFQPAMLDQITAAGEWVWVGRGALGARDGRIAFYRRSHVRVLGLAPGAESVDPEALVLLELLEQRGAVFGSELLDVFRESRPNTSETEFRTLLWELVWAGLVTNDTFAPLLNLGATRRRRSPLIGRWSIVARLAADVPDTEKALAWSRALIERYGVVSARAAQVDGVPGGFASLYAVMKGMEESGQVRRGYFVGGLGGAQFCAPAAVDELRHRGIESGDGMLWLAVVDPANPYGGLLPWPQTGNGESTKMLRRVPGAWVLLRAGEPLLYVGSGRRRLYTFPALEIAAGPVVEAAFAQLNQLPRTGRKLLVIERIDDQPVAQAKADWRAALAAAGFRRDHRGMVATGWGPDRSGSS